LTSSRYYKAVKDLISASTNLRVAVAFWGDGAQRLFPIKRTGKTRVICNLLTGGTNPKTIAVLRSRRGYMIRTLDKLHAKVILGDNKAIVGSANVSCNGLGLEGHTSDSWLEAGLLSSDGAELAALGNWFERLWSSARPITISDLQRAQVLWDRRRRPNRTPGRPSEGLWAPHLYRNARVYLVIWREGSSGEAAAAFSKWKEKEAPDIPEQLYTWYEDWDCLPKRGVLISVRYGTRGAIRVNEISRRLATVPFRDADGDPGHLDVCVKQREILDRPVSRKDLAGLEKRLRRNIKAVWSSPKAVGDDDGKRILLYDALQAMA